MLACMCCACAGKTCLELGAGAGLLGVALAQLDVRELLLTDGDQTTLGNLRHNLRLNGVCESDVRARELFLASPVLTHHATSTGPFFVQVKSLHSHVCAEFVRHHDVSLSNSSCCHEAVLSCWSTQGVRVERLAWSSGCCLHPDIVLASDVIYDPECIGALVALLQTLLLPGPRCTPVHPASA